MPSFRTAATVLVLLAVAYGGWVANGWRIDAARAKALADRLTQETVKRVDGERARVRIQKELDEARNNVAERVRTITKTVVKHVPDGCDLDDDVAGVLQRFREGNLSNSAK